MFYPAQLDAAFWIWFGTLAFVISIIGTLVAFAGPYLQDELCIQLEINQLKQVL